jgi:hypothetical protein
MKTALAVAAGLAAAKLVTAELVTAQLSTIAPTAGNANKPFRVDLIGFLPGAENGWTVRTCPTPRHLNINQHRAGQVSAGRDREQWDRPGLGDRISASAVRQEE